MKKQIFPVLFALMLFASMCIQASDSLNVKKVRFFVEPKFMLNVPTNKTTNTTGYDWDDGDIPSHGGNYTLKNTTQKNATFNIGLSAGLSVKLCKHLFYEFTLAYYHTNQSSKTIQTQNYISGSPETDINSTGNSSTYNYIGLGNGISYRCHKFSFTHTILLYQSINYRQSTAYATQDNYGYSTQSYLSSGNVFKDGFDIKLMSEHKIGYSFLNDRIVPFVGVNFNWSSSFNTYFGKMQFKPVWVPFASVKINF